MTDIMQEFANVARRNKFSGTLGMSDEDIVSVWEYVSEYIQKQMLNGKGVTVNGLGTFTFVQKKLDVGNNKYILIRRPVFQIQEKFAQTHGLQSNKYHLTGSVTCSSLNFSALSMESPFKRDVIESCVREVLLAMQRSLASGKNIEFLFSTLGRLQIRDGRVKMKFFKEFINSVDGSGGKLIDSMKNRPGTCDSVISNRPPTRPISSNTFCLPKIEGAISCDNAKQTKMPTIDEEEGQGKADDVPKSLEEEQEKLVENDLKDEWELEKANKKTPINPRESLPLAKACAVTFDSILPTVPNTARTESSAKSLIMRRSLSPLAERPSTSIHIRSQSADCLAPPKPIPEVTQSAPTSACGHRNAGQELCYLCHQRERRNIPIFLKEERKKREAEEDRLLDEYQKLKITETVLKEQENALERRHNEQKNAAFNLGVAEAIRSRKPEKGFYSSYIFEKRPLTPPRFISQTKYNTELGQQVAVKEEVKRKRKEDESFLERLEQVQLAEDLAVERQEVLKNRDEQKGNYRRALDTQLRYKPLPIPARVSDSDEPIFGKADMANERLAERRRRAVEYFRDQREVVEQRKRDRLLRKLREQKEEEEVLKKNKVELKEDLANRYSRAVANRRRLEEEWQRAAEDKKHRDTEERSANFASHGELMHEQCDKYGRCGQCKRRLNNCGESNIWRDTRYVPGARIMV